MLFSLMTLTEVYRQEIRSQLDKFREPRARRPCHGYTFPMRSALVALITFLPVHLFAADNLTTFRLDANGVPKFTGKFMAIGSPAVMVFLP